EKTRRLIPEGLLARQHVGAKVIAVAPGGRADGEAHRARPGRGKLALQVELEDALHHLRGVVQRRDHGVLAILRGLEDLHDRKAARAASRAGAEAVAELVAGVGEVASIVWLRDQMPPPLERDEAAEIGRDRRRAV